MSFSDLESTSGSRVDYIITCVKKQCESRRKDEELTGNIIAETEQDII